MNKKRVLVIGRRLLVFIICLSFMICGESVSVSAETKTGELLEISGAESAGTVSTGADSAGTVSKGTVSSVNPELSAGTFTAVYVPEDALPVYTEGDFQVLTRNVYAETENSANAESSVESELADKEGQNNGTESVSETASKEQAESAGESAAENSSDEQTTSAGESVAETSSDEQTTSAGESAAETSSNEQSASAGEYAAETSSDEQAATADESIAETSSVEETASSTESVIETLSAEERAARTAESGLYKSQFSGSILEFLYNALEQCTLTPQENGITFTYYYGEGETYNSVKTLYRSNWFSVLYGYKNDHPELFYWAKNSCSGGGLTDCGDYCTGKVSYLVETKYYADDDKDTAEAVLDSAISLVDRNASRYTQVKSIYNWLCAYAEYDTEALNASSDSEEFFMAHSELGILMNQKGVCESYAKVFKLLCERLDIPCLIVTSGTYDGDSYSHGWNYVKMEDGSWYMVDATFGDTGSDASEKYFLVSNEPYIDQYHTCDNLFAYPATSTSDYVPDEEENQDDIPLLEAPVLTSLKLTTSGLQLSWNPVDTSASEIEENAEIRYRIYRIYDGGWVMLDETSVNSWTDESVVSGVSYTYSVEAVSADGTPLSKMNETGLTARYIAAPCNIKTTNTASGVKITWTASAGAEKYRVFRRIPGHAWVILADTTSLNYTDTKAASGATYVYTVRCINAKASAYTSAYFLGTQIMYLKEPVTKVSNASGGVSVTWTKISGAAGYNVYRRLAGGGWKLLKVIKSGSMVSYKDTTNVSGYGYYYTVRAINGSYISSYNSGSGVVYLIAPKKISLSYYNVRKVRKGITVSWTKTSGASGYYLYRKVYGGSWVKIATIKKGTSVKFTDTSAKKGKKYSYAVQAYYGSFKSVFTFSGYLKR